ncbi:SCO family protein [Litorilinea aerophila]|uniref:SCO family protein n=1 Tax=Litorilinea aerophila TaxID=1204385 RepID=A0A540VCT3_9CHLR|nr:SCO family protein [Litorilinea aerophila]MCC9077716.1 SCO family protein [Litorilinea aerophila]
MKPMTQGITLPERAGTVMGPVPAFRRPWLWASLLALPILGLLAFVIFQPIQVLPRIALAPGYAFVDQNGQRLTSEDLRGRLALYTFTYTGCLAPCPDPGVALARLQQELADLDTGSLPLSFVTISFDPDRDDPAALRRYGAQLGMDPARWHGVTGQEPFLKQVIGGGFGVYYQRQDDGSFQFDPTFVLVDGWGIIRARYRTATPDVERLRRDIGLVVREVENSRGIQRYAYEAAHLFLCYPK